MIPNTSTDRPKRTIWLRIASRMIKPSDPHCASPNVQPSAQSAMAGDLITPWPEQRGHPLLTLAPIHVLQQLFRQLVIVRQVPVPSMVTQVLPHKLSRRGMLRSHCEDHPLRNQRAIRFLQKSLRQRVPVRVPRDHFLQHPSRVISPTLLAGRNDVINRMHLPPIGILEARPAKPCSRREHKGASHCKEREPPPISLAHNP